MVGGEGKGGGRERWQVPKQGTVNVEVVCHALHAHCTYYRYMVGKRTGRCEHAADPGRGVGGYTLVSKASLTLYFIVFRFSTRDLGYSDQFGSSGTRSP